LRRAGNGELLFRETGTGSDVMTERTWNLAVSPDAVEIEIADLAPDGHVNTDDIASGIRSSVWMMKIRERRQAPRTEADRPS